MHDSRRQPAFTLIELLVVIAIISLLMGVLLPALGRARACSRAAVCGSDLRQLAIANSTYSVENQDRFVPGAANFLKNRDRWHGRREKTSQPFDPRRGPLTPYLSEPDKIKRCPEFVNPSPGFEAGCGGFGYNKVYVGSDEPGALSTALGARASSFRDLVRTVMFGDAAFAQLGDAVALIEYSFVEPPQWVGAAAMDPYPSIHFRHGGTANVVWLDAHVDRRTLIFTRASPAYGVSESENRTLGLGWFGPDDNSFFDRE